MMARWERFLWAALVTVMTGYAVFVSAHSFFEGFDTAVGLSTDFGVRYYRPDPKVSEFM